MVQIALWFTGEPATANADTITKRVLRWRLLLVGVLGLIGGCATPVEPSAPAEPIPMTFTIMGHDALAQRYIAEVEAAFTASARFKIVDYRSPSILVVTMHDAVRPERFRRLSYALEFSIQQADNTKRVLGRVRGQCWPGRCARPALAAAERFWSAANTAQPTPGR